MIFLSVIVPCYNAARTIPDTLNCLIKEIGDSCNYEIVVVDDGSTDNSAEVIRSIALNNSEIILVKKKNGGVSVARNFGLNKASGEYVWFFDADDLCFKGAISKLINLLLQKKPDVCNFWSYTVDSHTKLNIDKYNNTINSTILFEGQFKDYLINKNIMFSCWSSIVKRSLLMENDIHFLSNLHISEDVVWNMDIARKCPEAYFISTNLRVVKYMVFPGSIVNNINPGKAKLQLLSYIDYAHYLRLLKPRCPKYLHVALSIQEQNVRRKLITRLLSSKTGFKESEELILKIFSTIDMSNTKWKRVYNVMMKYPIIIPYLQLLYRNIFLKLIKPFISRN